MNIFEAINSLVEYGVRENLIEKEDKVWAVNRVLEILNMDFFNIHDGAITYLSPTF